MFFWDKMTGAVIKFQWQIWVKGRSNLAMQIQYPTDHSTWFWNVEKNQKNCLRKRSQFVTVAEEQTKEFSRHANGVLAIVPICSVPLLSFIVLNKA